MPPRVDHNAGLMVPPAVSPTDGSAPRLSLVPRHRGSGQSQSAATVRHQCMAIVGLWAAPPPFSSPAGTSYSSPLRGLSVPLVRRCRCGRLMVYWRKWWHWCPTRVRLEPRCHVLVEPSRAPCVLSRAPPSSGPPSVPYGARLW